MALYYFDAEERYPIFTETASENADVIADLTDEEYADFLATMKRFDEWQDRLSAIANR